MARRGAAQYGSAPLERPVVFDFDAGLPDPATYPVDDLIRLSESVLRSEPAAALHYGRDELMFGYRGLRESLAATGGVGADQVMLTSGGAQAISLACMALADPGDAIAVEIPTWGYMLREIELNGARAIAIETDAEGLRVDLLADAIARDRIRVLYVIPNFSVPTGACLSLERRLELVALAERAQFTIIEDDTYGPLRYGGTQLPSLFELDPTGRVVKIDTFSKTIAPGLRLGWATGSPNLIGGMAAVRRDLGMSQWIARTIDEFIREGLYARHVAHVKDLYRAKRDAAASALDRHVGPAARWRRPDGGFFYWLEFAQDIDAIEVMRRAAQHGVVCRPGERFFGSPEDGRQHVRLAFSMYGIDALDAGIKVLGDSLEA